MLDVKRAKSLCLWLGGPALYPEGPCGTIISQHIDCIRNGAKGYYGSRSALGVTAGEVLIGNNIIIRNLVGKYRVIIHSNFGTW